MQLVEQYLLAFLKNEVEKTGLKHVIVGLSGGIDSAVVAILCQKAFGKKLHCVLMPSDQSSPKSMEDALKLCGKFDISHEIVSIAPMAQAYFKSSQTALQKGNFCARLRMGVLYDKSAEQKALVIGTSNKTELLLGYGTLYGDLASALNPIGDLYKTQIYKLARHLHCIGEILNKPPSADLYEGQSDKKELGYPYERLDFVLNCMVEKRQNDEEILKQGVDQALLNFCKTRIYHNQFKRKMPIIAKLTHRSIGHDFLYPRDIGL